MVEISMGPWTTGVGTLHRLGKSNQAILEDLMEGKDFAIQKGGKKER